MESARRPDGSDQPMAASRGSSSSHVRATKCWSVQQEPTRRVEVRFDNSVKLKLDKPPCGPPVTSRTGQRPAPEPHFVRRPRSESIHRISTDTSTCSAPCLQHDTAAKTTPKLESSRTRVGGANFLVGVARNGNGREAKLHRNASPPRGVGGRCDAMCQTSGTTSVMSTD